MKHIFITIVAFLSALSVWGQGKSLLDYPTVQLGTYVDGKPLLCHFIPTDGEVRGLQFTSDSPLLLIRGRQWNKMFNTETLEEIAEFDLKGKLLAQFCQDGYLVYSPGQMFSFRPGKPSFFNYKGEKVWSSNDQLITADRDNNVAVCSGNRNGDKLNAYDMTTGKALWSKTIKGNNHYLWADMYVDKADKRICYLMGDSLIRLNIVTGDTLRHAFMAGVKEPMKSRFSIVKQRPTLPSGDFTREAYFSSGVNGAILTGTHSNMLFAGDSLFVADAEHLYCLDRNLRPIWATDFPAESGSKSAIKVFGNQIRIQNYGIAFQNGFVCWCGRPFTATYDMATGNQTSLATADIKKKVIGGLMVQGRTYWQTDNEFFFTDNADGTLHKMEWKPNTSLLPDERHPDFMICDTIGIVKDGIMQYMVTDSNQLLVEVYGQDVNVLKAGGDCERLSADSVYLHDTGNVYSTNNTGDKANDFIVIDPATRKVECSMHMKGKVLQDKSGNIFVLTKPGVGVHRAASH